MASTLIVCRSQSETVAPDKTIVSTTDCADPIITPDATVPPVKTVASTTDCADPIITPDTTVPHADSASSQRVTRSARAHLFPDVHADSSPLPMFNGDRVFNVYFY